MYVKLHKHLGFDGPTRSYVCLFIGITIQLCPSINEAKQPLLLDAWWMYMHACSKKGRRLENKKIL